MTSQPAQDGLLAQGAVELQKRFFHKQNNDKTALLGRFFITHTSQIILNSSLSLMVNLEFL